MTEIATQPENGTAQVPAAVQAGTTIASESPTPGFQKRIDKLTRARYELEADLERAVKLIERYKVALRAARSANHA